MQVAGKPTTEKEKKNDDDQLVRLHKKTISLQKQKLLDLETQIKHLNDKLHLAHSKLNDAHNREALTLI